MKLYNKYVIGTMVMFYELQAVKDFVNSVIGATSDIENKENIKLDFLLNLSEYSEKISKTTTIAELNQMFLDYCVQPLLDAGIQVQTSVYDNPDTLYAVGDYRRDLNYNNCKHYDFIVWGEADCLMPKQYFHVIESIRQYTNQNNIYRYCVTFAIRKMWDSSWGVLEHVDFEKEVFMESTDPRCDTTPSSIWYYMSEDEMNTINDSVTELDIRMINYPRFDGSLLTISNDLLLGGVNIPPAVPCCGEDTAFQKMAQIIMGQKYTQFIVKNILKVHNRNHPYKRMYVEGEDGSENSRQRRGSNQIWKMIYNKAVTNLGVLGSEQQKFKTL